MGSPRGKKGAASSGLLAELERLARKRKSVERLVRRGATPGERSAAAAALERIVKSESEVRARIRRAEKKARSKSHTLEPLAPFVFEKEGKRPGWHSRRFAFGRMEASEE